jgi:hypothetical protein
VRIGHAIALVGALVLLLVMAMDWYSSAQGDEARRIESITDNPSGAESGEIDRRLNEEARFVAEGEEKNAWQTDALIDRILLGLMLGAIALAVLTALARGAGAKPTTGLGPAGLAAIFATAAAVLVAYRIIQEPGLDAGTNVKAGAPLALLPLALIALGSSSALKADDKEAADGGAARGNRAD